MKKTTPDSIAAALGTVLSEPGSPLSVRGYRFVLVIVDEATGHMGVSGDVAPMGRAAAVLRAAAKALECDCQGHGKGPVN